MEIPKGITIEDLLLNFAPDLTKKMIEENGTAAELAGTEFTMVVSVSGKEYSYVVKDGTEFEVKEGGLDNPLVSIGLSTEDLQKMIDTDSLDMLLGIQSDLSKKKYDTLQALKGSFVTELTNDDGSLMVVNTCFNGADTFKMKTADSIALVNKETNPVNLFMSGAILIEGDMAFAMQTQPLFT